PVEGVKLYNEEAEAFKVSDADGSLIGIIITDYFPRDSKRGGAWMTNFCEQYKDEAGNNIRPVIVNVGNFNKPDGDKPALLNIDQVETMFHEFGHALHGLLSQCRYKGTSGTSVKRDFVELPSQINENWAFEPEVLATYAFHWQTREVIPEELVAKVQAAANFNQGFTTGELCAASILDMKWHELQSIEGIDVDSFEQKVCSEMGLIGEIIPRYRSTYFNHIFGSSGYSAGYYSYLWAEVLDKDAFELFKQKGIFDKETAMSFRHNVLEAGGSEEPMVLYKRFRGADPDSGALLRARGLN
ncbi:MAG: M3 family metallopeptidase, partial [Bacteroidales bacterium]|nr:M3 family metallopeptidase [Bacteroidales bacterium]